MTSERRRRNLAFAVAAIIGLAVAAWAVQQWGPVALLVPVVLFVIPWRAHSQ